MGFELSAAWDLNKNPELFVRASQLLPVKEHPLLRNKEMEGGDNDADDMEDDDDHEGDEKDDDAEEQDAHMQGDSDEEEESMTTPKLLHWLRLLDT